MNIQAVKYLKKVNLQSLNLGFRILKSEAVFNLWLGIFFCNFFFY